VHESLILNNLSPGQGDFSEVTNENDWIVLISVHKRVIEIVENTLPRKLLWEMLENLGCFDFA